MNGGEEEVNLQEVIENVKNHKGNVWLPIVLLTREDAVNTGFDCAESLRTLNLLGSMKSEMAKCFKIRNENFRCYGAFHDEGIT